MLPGRRHDCPAITLFVFYQPTLWDKSRFKDSPSGGSDVDG